jgi:oxygen-independent coproporphyrinogen-3 oxidase
VDLGVYVHFPYCRARCPYCDFAIAVTDQIPHARYADVVLAELADRAPAFTGTLRSIYFGGGTPALWDPAQIARVIAAVKARFGEPEEITVEANPLDAPSFAALRAAGANRLSLGAQSFDPPSLVQLGRDHDAPAASAAVAAARAVGFDNLSIDLIFAVPGRRELDRTLATAIELAPDHISAYQLTVEDRTPFGAAARAGRLRPEPDDVCADQFERVDSLLSAAGYEHYEVSSYARPGRRSRHNQLYWRGAAYLGLGNGAHSFNPPRRWSNHRSVERYLTSPDKVDEARELTAAELAEDLLWLGLRTSDGVEISQAGRLDLPRLVAAGLVEVGGGRVRPTRRGLLLADEIASTIIG